MARRSNYEMRRRPIEGALDKLEWFINRELHRQIRNIVDVLNFKQDMAEGTTAERLAIDPSPGERWFDTDTNSPWWWNSDISAWVPAYTPPTPPPTLELSYGSLYVSSTLGNVVTMGTWEKANPGTTDGMLSGFSMPVDNRLQKTSDGTGIFFVSLHATMLATVLPGDYVQVGISRNGSVPAAHRQSGQLNAGVGAGNWVEASVSTTIQLSKDHYVEAWLVNNSSSNPISMITAVMAIYGLQEAA
jgi:hypothetical protein